MKKCSKCKTEKPLSEFHTNRQTKSGLTYDCKVCRAARNKKWYDATKEERQAYRDSTKESRKEYYKARYEANKEEVKARSRKWWAENREYAHVQWKERYEKNRERYLANRMERHYERMDNDPLYRLKRIGITRINDVLRRNGYTKKSSTNKMLGCDWETFKTHIEDQFEPWMNWDNHGNDGWEVDHIVPLNTANTEDELMELFHYTNTRPLCGKENRSRPLDGSDL